MFGTLSGFYSIQFFHNLLQPLPHIEKIYYLDFLDFLLLFVFFFIHSGELIYHPPRIKFERLRDFITFLTKYKTYLLI